MPAVTSTRRHPWVPGRHVPMVFTLLASLMLGALLSGCDQDRDDDAAGSGMAAAVPAAVAAQQRTQPGTLAPVTTSASTDIPGSSPGAYIGRWAASASLCKNGAWEFAPGHVSTAGETSCDLDTPTISGNTFELNATCKAEGAATQETWRLVFNGTDTRTAQPTTMNVQRDAHEPVQLVRCPL